MNLIRVSTVKNQAARILREKSPQFRKTVLLHGAVSMGFLLITALVGFFLNRAMADNQGLSAMGNTAILRTAQVMLTLIGNILLPFWEIGVLYTAVRAVRGESTEFPWLARGFHRLGLVIRYFLLWFVILMAVGLACSNVIMAMTMLLPAPRAISDALSSVDPAAYTDFALMFEDILKALSQVPKTQLLLYFVPMGILYVAAYITLLIMLSYRFKMSRYLLLDETPMRAKKTLGTSNRITKGERGNLFKLDLSFWWYYLLQIVVAAIVYLPDILSAAGVTLPVDANTANLLAYVVYCVFSLLLAWSAGAYYQTTIACAYETLKPLVNENSNNP